MHKAQGGDSGSFSPETPGCLALHKEHGALPPLEYIMDGCRIFEKGLSQQVWRHFNVKGGRVLTDSRLLTFMMEKQFICCHKIRGMDNTAMPTALPKS